MELEIIGKVGGGGRGEGANHPPLVINFQGSI